MVTHQVRGHIFHATIPSAQLASELMASGAPADIAEATAIFRAVLACQEVRDTEPHRGNFRWELEDEVVEDLNAVQFVLFYCIPVLCKTSDALPPDLVAAMRHAVALGLEEIARIDVALAYTNIVLKDIANSCLGGQLLGDNNIDRRGREKLVRWMAHVDTYGLPAEYNSPNYASVAVRVLGRLAELTEDKHTRIRARTMLARLGLSAALHVHPGIGCWAGPFSRALRRALFALYTRRPVAQLPDDAVARARTGRSRRGPLLRRARAGSRHRPLRPARPGRLDAAYQRQSRARVDRDRAGRRDLDRPAQSRFSAGGSAPGQGGRRRQRCPVDGRPAARADRSGRRCPHPPGRTGRSSGPGDVQLYGYTGPAKTFWEMAKPGSFYQGQPRCGFYAELAERTDYASGANFAAEVATGALVDEAAPPATYTAGGARASRGVRARRPHTPREVDLYEWSLKRRWTQDGSLDWPMHESPYARQSASGQVSIGGATLTCDKGPIWLCACPGGKRYVAAYSGIGMTSLRLAVPGDVVELAEMGAGTVIWDEGQIKIEAILP